MWSRLSITSPKKAAYKWVSENLLPLEVLEEGEDLDFGNFNVRPFPPEIAKIWLPFARILLAERTTPILTPFGRRVSEGEAFSIAEKCIKQIPNQDVVDIELASLANWKEDMKAKIYRAQFDPTMWMARWCSADPKYHPEPIKPKCKRSMPKSFPLASIRQVKIRNPAANTGFWRLKRWNDQRRSDHANEEYHLAVFMDATRWEEKMIDKKNVKMKRNAMEMRNERSRMMKIWRMKILMEHDKSRKKMIWME